MGIRSAQKTQILQFNVFSVVFNNMIFQLYSEYLALVDTVVDELQQNVILRNVIEYNEIRCCKIGVFPYIELNLTSIMSSLANFS